jgi:bifunctional non-homologous end joining protein LigD
MTPAIDLLAQLSEDEAGMVRRAPAPRRFEAMKAVLTDEPFSDPAWVFERKLDGIRCLAVRDGGAVRLLSRNDLSLNSRYPEIAAALEGRRADRFAVDGEVVAFDGAATSFARLARRGREPGIPVYLYAFDVLWLDGLDVRGAPLLTRKRLLRAAVEFDDPIRLTPHRRRDGERLFRDACRRGWEGLIAKRAESAYTPKRSRDWLKLKCSAQQELVIGGYTAPRGSREELGALLLGYYDGGGLRYAGKVGTGFTRDTLRDLARRLKPLRRPDSPFSDERAPARDTTWVDPELVGEVAFTEWTRDGSLRHAAFMGLRDDKAAKDVVRETTLRSSRA